MDSLANVEEEDRLDNNNDNEEENPYQNIIINDFDRYYVIVNTSQLGQ